LWRRSIEIDADIYRTNELNLSANHPIGMMQSPRLSTRPKAAPGRALTKEAAGMHRRKHRATRKAPCDRRARSAPAGGYPKHEVAQPTDAQLMNEYTRFSTFAVLFLYFNRTVPPQLARIGDWKLQGIRAPCCGLAPGRGAHGSTPTRDCNERPELRS
jgi:hypothetical protein